MPAAICHYLHGERVWKVLQKRKPLLSSDAFFLGVQGPDVFYFHRALPWHKKKKPVCAHGEILFIRKIRPSCFRRFGNSMSRIVPLY